MVIAHRYIVVAPVALAALSALPVFIPGVVVVKHFFFVIDAEAK
jgi:hypothetical protein